MANSNGQITAPVTLGDVNSVLGDRHTDVAAACKDTKVNKWAKYKPLKLSVIDTITGQWDATNNTWLTTATWWKGQARSGAYRPQYTCGLVINCYDNDRASFKDAVDNGNGGWTWDAPTGGAASPYRLHDFAGYEHRASPLLEGFSCPDEVPPNQKFSITIQANTVSNRYILSLNDIFANSASNKIWYFGVICYSGSTKKGEVTSKVPIGQDAELVDGVTHSWGEIKLTAPAATGTYKLYPCIMYASNYANNPTGSLDNLSTPVVQTFVVLPLPTFAAKTIKVTSQTATKEWMSVYAVFRVAYSDSAQTIIDFANTTLNIQIVSTAGASVGSVSRTNTITMMLGSTTYSGFTTQTETFTYSGTTNNPHYYGGSSGTFLTYSAFGTGSTSLKQQNMYEAIQQAKNGNAYLYVNQNNGNNTSSPMKVSIGVMLAGGGRV